MSLSHRASAQTQRAVALIAISVVLIAMVLTPLKPVFASGDENGQQQRVWLPAAPIEAFAGEISYDFDSVLNKTTAIYTAPLGKRDFLHRVFFPAPTVHTITATYVFTGRIASHAPDTIRVRLESDEYIDVAPESQLGLGAQRTMTIDLGAHVVPHHLSLSERIEPDSNPHFGLNRLGYSTRATDFRLPQSRRSHVKRKATTWLSTCEFLSLITQREIRGTVAGLDFTLNHEVVTGLNLFAARMLPDSAQERSVPCQ